MAITRFDCATQWDSQEFRVDDTATHAYIRIKRAAAGNGVIWDDDTRDSIIVRVTISGNNLPAYRLCAFTAKGGEVAGQPDYSGMEVLLPRVADRILTVSIASRQRIESDLEVTWR